MNRISGGIVPTTALPSPMPDALNPLRQRKTGVYQETGDGLHRHVVEQVRPGRLSDMGNLWIER